MKKRFLSWQRRGPIPSHRRIKWKCGECGESGTISAPADLAPLEVYERLLKQHMEASRGGCPIAGDPMVIVHERLIELASKGPTQ